MWSEANWSHSGTWSELTLDGHGVVACPNNSVLLSLDATIGVSRVQRLEAPNPTQSTRRHSFAMSVVVFSVIVCALGQTWLLEMQYRTIVTWLILPVVICLSQRLSHACLSINDFIQWNCEWLIKSVIVYLIVLTTWITVVILELIHAKRPDFWKGCIY